MRVYIRNLYIVFLRTIKKCKSSILLRFSVPKVKKSIDTIDYILQNNCSVSRFGDGELLIMQGWHIGFQKEDVELALRLKEIIHSELSGHIVCLPNVFDDLSFYTDKAGIIWKDHLRYNYVDWHKYINIDKQYYDALISRFYIDRRDKELSSVIISRLRQIWDSRDIVLIEGEKSRMGYGNDLFGNANSIKRILCPCENAFSAYSRILEEALKIDKSSLILIALGPTATVLAYDLCKNGYQAIDLGHLDVEYEWFLQSASDKCVIKNKYVNEVGSREVSEVLDPVYQNQIITVIK